VWSLARLFLFIQQTIDDTVTDRVFPFSLRCASTRDRPLHDVYFAVTRRFRVSKDKAYFNRILQYYHPNYRFVRMPRTNGCNCFCRGLFWKGWCFRFVFPKPFTSARCIRIAVALLILSTTLKKTHYCEATSERCYSPSVLHTKSHSVDITLWNLEELGRTRALLPGRRIGYDAERRDEEHARLL